MPTVYAVLDTNIFVSALLNPKGPPGKIYQAIRSGLCVVVLTPALHEELRAVLEYPELKLSQDVAS